MDDRATHERKSRKIGWIIGAVALLLLIAWLFSVVLVEPEDEEPLPVQNSVALPGTMSVG